ncbi:MAG: hypothetical protein RIQ89_1944 [Bacteroidota bacterium]|jgi:hypothetical protein
MTPLINTSRAKKVDVNISDYDNIPLSMRLYDTSVTPKVVIDISSHGFTFYLKQGKTEKKAYTLLSGQASGDFLSRVGTEILNMQLMWQDIRDILKTGTGRLIMVVTRPDTTVYTYIVFNINGKQY